MKLANSILYLFTLLLISCSSNNKNVKEGIIYYEIDYPKVKDNFFLYHVLPKELKTTFKDDFMELKIKKANLENTLIIDSKNKKITAHYNYGEIFTSMLSESEISKIIQKHPKYKITFTKEKDTLIGFNIKKAIAINPEFPKEKIDIWYTEDIKLNNSNWFNGFQKIPGVLLKYSVYQYGIKMEFKASKFENVTIPDSIVNLTRPGKIIPHKEFDSRINELFESFK